MPIKNKYYFEEVVKDIMPLLDAIDLAVKSDNIAPNYALNLTKRIREKLTVA